MYICIYIYIYIYIYILYLALYLSIYLSIYISINIAVGRASDTNSLAFQVFNGWDPYPSWDEIAVCGNAIQLGTQVTGFAGTKVQILMQLGALGTWLYVIARYYASSYLLYWYKSTNTDAARGARHVVVRYCAIRRFFEGVFSSGIYIHVYVCMYVCMCIYR
jgi:hypothetical protein